MIVLTLLLSFLFIGAEMVSELGLGVSKKCTTEKRSGNVIGTMVPDKRVPRVLFASTASRIRLLNFYDGPIEFISGDFPVSLNDSFCLTCMKFNPQVAVLANCSAKTGRTYPPGSLAFGMSFGRFSILVDALIQVDEYENKTITGMRDFTLSKNHTFIIFSVHSSKSNEGRTIYTYFEYAKQAHIRSVLYRMIAEHQRKGTYLLTQKFWERTQGPTYTQEIQCGIRKIENLEAVISSYRTMQLNNMVFPPDFDIEKEMFEPITEDDVYRAGLAQKIGFAEAYGTHEKGDYFTYTECAYYNWLYMIPVAGVLFVVMVLYITGLAKYCLGTKVTVPYNSKTWFDEMVRRMQTREARSLFRKLSSASIRKMAKENTVDEVVLLRQASADMEVGYCRGGIMVNMQGTLPRFQSQCNPDAGDNAEIGPDYQRVYSSSEGQGISRRGAVGNETCQ